MREEKSLAVANISKEITYVSSKNSEVGCRKGKKESEEQEAGGRASQVRLL